MLKILQARLQQYVNRELADVQAGFRKGRGGASLVAQRLKCLPPMRETWVRSLGREDPLEKEMATHSSVLAWRIPGTAEPVGCRLWGRTELDMTEVT